MNPDDVEKKAVATPFGTFEYLYMPFGLRNASASLQRHMDNLFMNVACAFTYLDDILIFSETFEEHLLRLDTVLSRLQEHGLKVKGKKCDLFQREVRYLGHIVSEEGIAVDQDKVERVVTWPVPKNAKELRSFLVPRLKY